MKSADYWYDRLNDHVVVNCEDGVWGLEDGKAQEIIRAIQADAESAPPVDVDKLAYTTMKDVMDLFRNWTVVEARDDNRSTYVKVEDIIKTALIAAQGRG